MEFVLRARKAPTDPDRFLGAAGRAVRVEYLAQVITNTLFVSKGHRPDAILTIVCEDTADYSRAITLRGDRLGSLDDLTEQGLLKALAGALAAGRHLAKETSVEDERGFTVQAISFEHLVKQRLAESTVCLLDKKGEDIRQAELGPAPVFLLTDHIPMPKKAAKSLVRLGARPVSLGPVMLHASQCVVVVQNEFDRRGAEGLVV